MPRRGQVERDLAGLVEAMQANRELQQALTSPLGAGQRQAEDRRGAEPSASASPPRLAGCSICWPNATGWAMLDEMLAVYRERLLQRSAQSSAPKCDRRLRCPRKSPRPSRRASARSPAPRCKVEAVVDPSLIGGVMAKVGSTVYDGTVKTQLEKLRKQLVGLEARDWGLGLPSHHAVGDCR